MKKLKTYLMRYWYLYLFSMVCMVSAIALDMITPQITRHIIDDVIVGGQAELLMRFLFDYSVSEWDAPFYSMQKNLRGTVSG